MPFTYTSRKGITSTLYRINAAAGKQRHIFAQQSKKGDPVDELPAGYRVKETAAGVVSVVPDDPSLILPKEKAAVESALRQVPRAADYRVVVQHDRIELYEKITSGRYGKYYAPARGEPDRHEPVLRFALIDPAQRVFRADPAYPWGREKWVWSGRFGDISDLAASLMPHLAARAKVDPYLLDDFGLMSPQSDQSDHGWAAMRDARTSTAAPASVHRLKVTLKHSRPPIWRRLLVPSDITLDRLHDVLQVVMGWDDEHLHLFEIDSMTFSDPRYRDGDIFEESAVRLDQAAPFAKTRFRYEYDFGDSWEHEIQIEAVQPPEPEQRYPVCIAGERAAPPEDSGGVWRYGWIQDVLADPRDPDHGEMLDWLGGPLDPETFDLDAINRGLAGIW